MVEMTLNIKRIFRKKICLLACGFETGPQKHCTIPITVDRNTFANVLNISCQCPLHT